MPDLLTKSDQDAQFFAQYPDRQARIRLPESNRESQGEFWSLGPHESARRRIIVWRIPRDNPYAKPHPGSRANLATMKIPFLAFADEAIEDTDAVLLPIIKAIMEDAAKKYGAWR